MRDRVFASAHRPVLPRQFPPTMRRGDRGCGPSYGDRSPVQCGAAGRAHRPTLEEAIASGACPNEFYTTGRLSACAPRISQGAAWQWAKDGVKHSDHRRQCAAWPVIMPTNHIAIVEPTHALCAPGQHQALAALSLTRASDSRVARQADRCHCKMDGVIRERRVVRGEVMFCCARVAQTVPFWKIEQHSDGQREIYGTPPGATRFQFPICPVHFPVHGRAVCHMTVAAADCVLASGATPTDSVAQRQRHRGRGTTPPATRPADKHPRSRTDDPDPQSLASAERLEERAVSSPVVSRYWPTRRCWKHVRAIMNQA